MVREWLALHRDEIELDWQLALQKNLLTRLIHWSKTMILHTTEVMPLANYRLSLRFNSGLSGEVDLAGELDGEVFGALRDPALFATAC
jgi:hypothetical protein